MMGTSRMEVPLGRPSLAREQAEERRSAVPEDTP
jgi:hypothetical protein